MSRSAGWQCRTAWWSNPRSVRRRRRAQRARVHSFPGAPVSMAITMPSRRAVHRKQGLGRATGCHSPCARNSCTSRFGVIARPASVGGGGNQVLHAVFWLSRRRWRSCHQRSHAEVLDLRPTSCPAQPTMRARPSPFAVARELVLEGDLQRIASLEMTRRCPCPRRRAYEAVEYSPEPADDVDLVRWTAAVPTPRPAPGRWSFARSMPFMVSMCDLSMRMRNSSWSRVSGLIASWPRTFSCSPWPRR